MQPAPTLTNAELTKVRAPLESAWTLPPRVYTDASVYDWEVQELFGPGWVAVARVEQFPEPPSHLAVEVAGQPVLLTRGSDGTIRAMSNVCLHRSMPLAAEAGSGRYVVCPYHLWAYGSDGALHTAPMMGDDFEPAACRLPGFAVEVWEGFVFVSLDPDAEPLGPRLEPLRRRVADYRMADLVIAASVAFDSPWNWKLLVENFMEAYHHIGPHRDTFQQSHPARSSFVMDNEGGPWSLLDMPGVERGDEPDGLPFLPGVAPERRSDLLAFCVFPLTLIATTGTLVTWYQVTPDAHDHFRLTIHVLLDRETAKDPEMAEALPLLVDGVSWIHNEDIPVNLGPWRGLHAPTAAQGRLSPYEAAIWQFNQFWLDRVDASIPA